MSLSIKTSDKLVRLAPLLAIAAIMLLVFGMGWHKAITLENIVLLRDRFHGVLAKHPVLSVGIYMLIYIATAALSLPGGFVLTLTGGLLFGWLVGGIAAIVAAGTGATLVFLIARAAIADTNLAHLAQKLAWVPGLGGHLDKVRNLDTRLEQMRTGFGKDAMSYLLFLRLVPAFPYWAVNLVAAILNVPLKTYVIATFLGIIPATLAFASLGAGLDSIVAAAKAEHMACVAANGAQACKLKIQVSSLVTPQMILAFVLLGCGALVPVACKKWRKSHAE